MSEIKCSNPVLFNVLASLAMVQGSQESMSDVDLFLLRCRMPIFLWLEVVCGGTGYFFPLKDRPESVTTNSNYIYIPDSNLDE